jgi:uncharacterized membrane protein YkoI
MKRIILAALVAAPFAVYAVGSDKSFKDCSTKASHLTKKTELMKTAKVKEADAKKAALGTAGAGASIVKGGIEVEEDCLVYSYHVKDPATKGQTEVIVDAGTGAILKQEHEGAVRTAMEKPVDKTKEVAGKAKEKMTGKESTNHSMGGDQPKSDK